MEFTKKNVRKLLNKQIEQLNDVIADVDNALTSMEDEFYRVSIFGSARIKSDTKLFKEVSQLATELSLRGVDIVTGGGPGLMQAANEGAKLGGDRSRSIGLHIELPFETIPNIHLDIKKHHRRFSSRLDEFMRISNAIVITEGGIGTILEFFYTWQLMQVQHIKPRPILLLSADAMWSELLDWLKKWPLGHSLMSPEDFDSITLCKSISDVMKILEPEINNFQKNKSII